MKKQYQILTALLLQQYVSAFANNSNDKPDGILIFSDEHCYQHFGCCCNPDLKTPNIDRMAKEDIQYHHFCITTYSSFHCSSSLHVRHLLFEKLLS